jgi:hypothetical protein
MMRAPMTVAGIAFGLCLAGAGVAWAEEEEQDRVYQRKGRGGRVLYTNIGNVSEGGIPLAAMELRELLALDLSTIPESTLPSLDQRISVLHEATRTSRACAQIRRAAEDSVAELMWNEERPEVLTCGGLTALTMLVGLLGSGGVVNVLRLGLLAGTVSAGYGAASGAWTRHAHIADGMRACSSDLPSAQPTDPAMVGQRLSAAADFQSSVQSLFDAREGQIDAATSNALR